jgi:hypothetical protein
MGIGTTDGAELDADTVASADELSNDELRSAVDAVVNITLVLLLRALLLLLLLLLAIEAAEAEAEAVAAVLIAVVQELDRTRGDEMLSVSDSDVSSPSECEAVLSEREDATGSFHTYSPELHTSDDA